MDKSRGYVACGLWVLATALMIYGTFDYHRDHTPAGLAWGVFMGMCAAQVTTWAIVEKLCRHDEVSVEQVGEIVDAMHEAKRALSRLH